MAKSKDDVVGRLLQEVFANRDGLKQLLEELVNQAMQQEVTKHVGADRHERAETRCGYRNGSKPRRTRVVGVFPNRSSCGRLIGALLREIHERWSLEQQVYFNFETEAETH
jgi:transposase-like protein